MSYSIPGVMNEWCPNEITPLTSDKARLASEIVGLNASGNTYLPAGLIWGWRTLSAELPYAEGVSDAIAVQDNISKHLILMTDGVNVTSKNVGEAKHTGWNPAEGNRITRELCTNIKDAGITVYTVAFQVGDAGTQALLRECATAPANAFDADNAQELAASFEKIAAKVAAIHLSK